MMILLRVASSPSPLESVSVTLYHSSEDFQTCVLRIASLPLGAQTILDEGTTATSVGT